MPLSIGIDLGTTNSCIAIWKRGKVEIIPDEFGNRTLPSIVSFNKNEIIVGATAKNNMVVEPENTIYESKRLIGRKKKEPIINNWPFKVTNNMFEIKNQSRLVSPMEIAGFILKKLKLLAENYLGCEVDSCVITVPAYFNDSQRSETKRAGELAGMEVLRIINEPTAASLCYGIDGKEDKNIIVVDCGGGTTDVTLLNISEGIFEVVATSGDTLLGGQDIDNLLIEHFIQEFKEKYPSLKFERTPRILRKIRNACENLKKRLSFSSYAKIEIESFYKGQDFVSNNMTTSKFNNITGSFYKRCVEILDDIFENSKGIEKGDIDEVVLVGGTTRIPKLRNDIEMYFNKTPHTAINPDEAIAHGAAIQAAILKPTIGDEIKDILLLDVAALSFGIESDNGLMNFIIPRNSTIPTKRCSLFTTEQDYQTFVDIKIYEGERKFVKHNNFLSKFRLDGIKRATRGKPRIEISFMINENGLLIVKAKEIDLEDGSEKEIVIERISSGEEEKLIEDAEEQFHLDLQNEKKLIKRKELEDYCYSVIKNISSNLIIDDPVHEERIYNKIKDCLMWLKDVKTLEVNVEDFIDWIDTIEDLLSIKEKPLEKYKGDEKGEFTTKIN